MFTIETKVLEKGTFRYKLRNVLDAICHPAKTKKMKSIYDKANALIDENIYSATFVLKFGTVWLDYDDLYEINTRPIEKDFIKNHTYVYFVDSDGNEHPLVDESYHYIYLCKYKSEDTPYDIGFITYLEEYGWYVMDYRMLLINKQTYEKSIFMDFIQKPLTKDKVHLDIILDDSKLIEARSLMKKYTFVCNVGRYVYKFLHTLDSVYLCLRFPFLYPRNRFTDRYYNNWKIQEKVDKWKKESTLSLRICMFKDESKYFCTQTNELPEVKQKQSDSNPENVMYYIDNGTKDGYYLYDKSQNQKLNSIVKVKNNNDSGYDMYIYHPVCKWLKIDDIINKDSGKIVFKHGKYTEVYTTIVQDRKLNLMANVLDWYHKYVLGVIFGIPTFNELDSLDEGWRRNFGIDICKEIKEQLKKEDYLYKYRIVQIKQKYGTLHWYDARSSKEILNIISKYENISYRTCISCGKPAKYITTGWVLPFCEECISESSKLSADEIDESGNIIKEGDNF